MPKVAIDTSINCCVVSFYIPRDIDEPAYLKGRVVVSCQDGVSVGDGVTISGRAVQYVLKQENELYLATNIVTNKHRHQESDPKWFIATIEQVQPADESNNVAAVAQLKSIKSQINDVIEQLA